MSANHPRVVAVDWSGAAHGASKKIWLAEADGSRLVGLPENGRTREGLADYLVGLAQDDPRLVVGLDFAFSLPSWFLKDHNLHTASDLWSLAASQGETWLANCEPPFWGRKGKKEPKLPSKFRDTETEIANLVGQQPKSAFQIHGPGTVGTGSIRGMPVLRHLQSSGFSIWPFDPPGWPRIIEIWPRAFYRKPVRKNSQTELETYLLSEYPDMNPEQISHAVASDDAFDAVVSALVMAEHAEELASLPSVSDPEVLLEGAIWYPGWTDRHD